MSTPALYEEAQRFAPWLYAVVGLVLLLLAALASIRMTTVVTPQAVTVKLGFLHSSRIPISDIVRAEALVYRPIADYGGWGVRGFRNRRALNARGNRGVLLLRQNGSTLIIGSQHPRDLLAALARAGVVTEDKLPADIREF